MLYIHFLFLCIGFCNITIIQTVEHNGSTDPILNTLCATIVDEYKRDEKNFCLSSFQPMLHFKSTCKTAYAKQLPDIILKIFLNTFSMKLSGNNQEALNKMMQSPLLALSVKPGNYYALLLSIRHKNFKKMEPAILKIVEHTKTLLPQKIYATGSDTRKIHELLTEHDQEFVKEVVNGLKTLNIYLVYENSEHILINT